MTATRITTLTHADLPPWAAIRGDGRLKLLMPIESACCDCGVHIHEIGEYFMVKNPVWDAAGMCRWGLLCIGCIENRLGRQLTPDDFTDAPINQLAYRRHRSPRFVDRLNGGSAAPVASTPFRQRPDTCSERRT